MEESASCWICLMPEDVLMSSPCACEGTIGCVHRQCLREWIQRKYNDVQQGPFIPVCSTCKVPYQTDELVERRNPLNRILHANWKLIKTVVWMAIIAQLMFVGGTSLVAYLLNVATTGVPFDMFGLIFKRLLYLYSRHLEIAGWIASVWLTVHTTIFGLQTRGIYTTMYKALLSSCITVIITEMIIDWCNYNSKISMPLIKC